MAHDETMMCFFIELFIEFKLIFKTMFMYANHLPFSTLFAAAIHIYATIAFIVIIIVIGVPMWWKTTEVYR